jgi:hypothetical protein
MSNFFDPKDIAPSKAGFFDPADLHPSNEQQSNNEENSSAIMDTVKGAGLGLAEGATGGLLPILQGIVGTGAAKLGELVGGNSENDEKLKQLLQKAKDEGKPFKGDAKQSSSLDDLINKYYEAKKMGEQLNDSIREKAPVTTTLASLPGMAVGVGKIVAPIENAMTGAKLMGPIGEGSSLLRKTLASGIGGATLGGMNSFGQGDAQLLKGEVGKTLGEVGNGATAGGIVGLAVPPVLSAVKSLGGTLIKHTGVVPWFQGGREFGEKLTNESVSGKEDALANQFFSMVRDGVLDKYDITVDKLNTLANEVGYRTKLGEPFHDALEQASKKIIPTIESASLPEKQEVIKYLESYIYPASDKQVNSSLGKLVTGISSEGATPDQLNVVLGELRTKTDFQNPEVKNNDLRQVLDDLRKNLIDNRDGELQKMAQERGVDVDSLTDLSQKSSRVLSGLKEMGISDIEGKTNPTLADSIEKQKIQFKSLLRQSGPTALDKAKEGFRRIGEAIPEIQQDIQPQYERLNLYRQLVGAVPEEKLTQGSVSSHGLLGGAKRFVGSIASTVGANIGNTERNLAEGYHNFLKANPLQLGDAAKMITDKFGPKAADFAQSLAKAANAPMNQRNIILYSLYQQPAFREMIERLNDN